MDQFLRLRADYNHYTLLRLLLSSIPKSDEYDLEHVIYKFKNIELEHVADTDVFMGNYITLLIGYLLHKKQLYEGSTK